MRKYLFLLLLFSSISFGQSKFTVYFDTDSDQLKLKELIRFDDFFRNKKVKFIKLIGYCDYRASNGYNETLAYNRAKFISNIIEKVADQKQIEIISKGENFEQNHDLKLNRKVEIYYEEIQLDEILDKDETIENNKNNNLSSQVTTAKVGDKLILKNLHFYNRSGIFVPESRPVLEELLQIMKSNPNLKIEIQGHICCQLGEDPEDIALIRAIAVHNYLVANDIDDSRLLYKSFGSTQPIHKIPEKNEKERNENRRVEILILEN